MTKAKLALSGVLAAMIFTACGDTHSTTGDTTAQSSSSAQTIELSGTDTMDMTERYALAYMWHEEKLAYDLYLEINEVQPAKQLYNIATKSETQHVGFVQELIEAYDIDIADLEDETLPYDAEYLENMPSGEFAIEKIQNLYNVLYAKGIVSQQDALEVGCMVEVTDIIDLDEFLSEVEEGSDIDATFTRLRDDSYKHYWAFDSGLKALGISEGCCVLGVMDEVDYCHPEYPNVGH